MYTHAYMYSFVMASRFLVPRLVGLEFEFESREVPLVWNPGFEVVGCLLSGGFFKHRGVPRFGSFRLSLSCFRHTL